MYYAKPEQSQEQIQEDLILLHRIYPNLNRQQLLEAKENLDRYFDLAVRIFLRLEREESSHKLDPSKEKFLRSRYKGRFPYVIIKIH